MIFFLLLLHLAAHYAESAALGSREDLVLNANGLAMQEYWKANQR